MDKSEETAVVRTVLENIADRIAEEQEYLTDLDSKIGDADFGANLDRGVSAALDEVENLDSSEPGQLVHTVGETLLEEMAGSSGILFGMSLMQASEELEDGFDPASIAAFAETYMNQVADRGDVDVGAKTMYDAIVPVVDVLKQGADEDIEPVELSARVVEAARRGAMFTSPLRAKRGRASYTELRSVGHPDPGAIGTYILLQEIHNTLEEHVGESVEPGLGDGLD